MFIVDLSNDDIVWLAWAAGLAQGSGNEGAKTSLGGILNRVQVYGDAPDVPEAAYEQPTIAEEDDFADEEIEAYVPIDEPTQAPPQGNPQNFGSGPVTHIG